jgi:peptidoglycan/xylan/chitin deacetylase (PgdA/CDA1 family)
MRIATIVIVVVAVALAVAAALAAPIALAGLTRHPLSLTIVVWVLLAATALYGVFERRAPVFGRIVGRGRPPGVIAITFDDGPTEPYTTQILDILQAAGARATFFVLGARAVTAPATLRRAIADGHEIGNHTWAHTALPLCGPSFIRQTIRATSDFVERSTGVRPRVFRAPFGWRNPWVNRSARREGCEPVAWTVGVHDTDRPGADVIVHRAIGGLRDGTILLLHDGRGLDPAPDPSQVVEALPRILDEARRRNFRLLTISDLLDESGRR